MAQRVGTISNYQPSKKSEKGFDLPAAFEVKGDGDNYAYKCKAWPTIGAKDNPQPNPVIAAIENMRAVDMQGPWCLDGYEKKKDGYTNKQGIQVKSTREFYATAIVEAAPGAKHDFYLDTDGNEPGAAPSAAPLTSVGGSSDDAVLLAAAALLQGPVERLTDAHEENIKATYYFLKGLAEKWRGLDATGWAPVPAPDMADAFS